jgi:hypothetical protein
LSSNRTASGVREPARAELSPLSVPMPVASAWQGMRRRRLAAYDSAVSSSLPPPNVTVVRRADQAAFKSLLLDTCATPRPHPLAVPA